jgi:hypothetical protein
MPSTASPRLQPKVRGMLIRTIALDLAGPTAVYYTSRAVGLGVITAALVAATPPLASATAELARRRRFDRSPA